MNSIVNVSSNQVQTINDNVISSFMAYIDAAPKTIETYQRAIRQFMKWLRASAIDMPTREDIIAYREFLKEEHKPSTVQNYITAVRLFFRWTEQERIYPNVADHIKGAKLDKSHKKDCLTARQVKQVLDAAKGDSLQSLRNYAILSLMFTGGLRTIEVSRANIEDMRTVGNNAVLYIQGKGREEKTEYVKLVPQVEDAIYSYLAARGHAEPSEPLFASTSNNSVGGRLSTRSVSGIVKSAFRKCGYDSDRLTAHSTRHTSVTLALLGGMDLQRVQQFARHSGITTTQIYAHNLERANNKCESVIGQAIF